MSDELKKDLEGDEARLETDEEDVEAHRALKGRALKGRTLKGENDDLADDVEAHMHLKGRALKGDADA
jgi:hypothetical protein